MQHLPPVTTVAVTRTPVTIVRTPWTIIGRVSGIAVIHRAPALSIIRTGARSAVIWADRAAIWIIILPAIFTTTSSRAVILVPWLTIISECILH